MSLWASHTIIYNSNKKGSSHGIRPVVTPAGQASSSTMVATPGNLPLYRINIKPNHII